MTVYIYGLKCPDSGALRYIGKSKDPTKRFSAHHRSAARFEYKHHTSRWLRKLGRAGLKPKMVILRMVAPGERWQDIERALILSALESGLNLTNATAGGEGLDYLDPKDDAAYRKNLSRSLKKLWNEPTRVEEARQRSLKAWADPDVTTRRIASMRVAQNRPDVKAKVTAALYERISTRSSKLRSRNDQRVIGPTRSTGRRN